MKTTLRAWVGSGMVALLGLVMIGASATEGEASAAGASGVGDGDGPTRAALAVTLPAPSASSAADEQLSALRVEPGSLAAPAGAVDVPKSGVCPGGMQEVEGDYCANVEQRCVRWLDPDAHMRCAEFAPDSRCSGGTTHKHFCIDRFEYPNQPGAKPTVMKTWHQAAAACTSEGKRLCGESEWTLACEGEEHLPYPYGYVRDSEACNIDKPHPDVDEKAIGNPLTREAEVNRLWQGEPSGSRDACVSPYGVHDMTGNVDEWVVNESGVPFQSGLKGGYWGPVRDRCRPMTTAHNEDFVFYQIGFRCCEDAPHGVERGEAPAEGHGSPAGHRFSAPSRAVPAT